MRALRVLLLAEIWRLAYSFRAFHMQPRLATRLILFWLICFAFSVEVLSERLPVRVYTSADGLGSSFIDSLMRDSRGFMWFCTRDGLSRFDGARFITYRIGDKNSPPGIETLYQTRDGNYWITTTGGLYRFKPDAVSKPDQTTGDRPFLNAELVSAGRGPLFEDRAGNLWYASNDLYRVKETAGKIVFAAEHLNLPSSPNHPIAIFEIREAPDGCIWLNTNQGVVCLHAHRV
jgi:ligand-binding sensor domain-containing protein